MSGSPPVAGELSQLLEDLARFTRVPVPDTQLEGLPPGTQVGRFVVQCEIGRGGFGVVYAAQDPELGRAVALKLLRPGASPARGGTEWIRAEAEAVARLNHPAIVTIFEAGRSEHGAFLVFELLQGEGLDARVARGGMTPEEVIRIGTTVTTALQHAHAAGMLHRDLKPVNVFLCAGGAVKVLDFGIARLFDREAAPGSGTPGYMAPEQRDGGTEDARTDLFALGVMLQQMLAGCVAAGPRTKSSRRTDALKRLTECLTQPNPDQRPASAREVLARLLAMQHEGIRSVRRWILASSLAVLAAVVIWAVVERGRPKEAPTGERLVVALAPTRNETGAPELDHLSELLRTALSDSPRFRVVANARMEAELRKAGKQPRSTDIGEWREAAGQVGASAVIFPVATRVGSGFSVGLTLDGVRGGGPRFSTSVTVPTIEGIPAALDRPLLDLRRAAGERAPDLERTSRPVADLTTPSLGAHLEYLRGANCVDSAAEDGGEDDLARCGAHLRKALDADPSFALAHYQLARVLGIADRGSAEAREHLDAAMLSPGRTSRRDAVLVRAWKDYLDGKEEAAIRGYSSLVADDPGDVEASTLAGDLLYHASRFGEAAPFLAKAQASGPPTGWILKHLVDAYALSGRTAELSDLLTRMAPGTPGQLRAAVIGNAWLGRHERSVELARGAAETFAGRLLLLEALVAAGDFEEADGVATALAAEEPGNVAVLVIRLKIGMAQGRFREAWRMVNAPSNELTSLQPIDLALLKATLAAGEGRLPRLRAETQKLIHASSEGAPLAAAQLALFGTRDDAAAMERGLSPGTTAHSEVVALQAWKAGDTSRAVSILMELEKTAPWPNTAIAPSYLLAEVARESDPSEAFAAAARYRAQMPRGVWRGWAYGRSLAISADASWRLGNREDAVRFVERLRRLISRADPGLELAREVVRLEGMTSTTGPLRGVSAEESK